MAAGAARLSQQGQLVVSNELMFISGKIKGSFGMFIRLRAVQVSLRMLLAEGRAKQEKVFAAGRFVFFCLVRKRISY